MSQSLWKFSCQLKEGNLDDTRIVLLGDPSNNIFDFQANDFEIKPLWKILGGNICDIVFKGEPIGDGMLKNYDKSNKLVQFYSLIGILPLHAFSFLPDPDIGYSIWSIKWKYFDIKHMIV